MPALVLALFVLGEAGLRLGYFGVAAVVRPWDYSAASFIERGIAVPDPDPRILWRLAPSRSTILKGARFTTNEAGFRGPPMARTKAAGEHRIAVLGASIAVGEGVADGEPFPRQLEAYLHEQGRSDVTVLNGAVQNYEASQLAAAYDTYLRPYDPDAVLVPLYPWLLARRDTPQLDALRRREAGDLKIRRLLAPSFLYRALRGGVRDRATRWLADDWSRRAAPRDPHVDRPIFEDVLEEFAARLAEDGTRVYLALLPKPDRHSERRLDQLRARAGAFAAPRGNVFVLDALAGVAPFVSRDDRVYPGDRHPNARFHALAGQAIGEALLPHLPPR